MAKRKLKFNAKNFMRVLRYIKRYPKKWNQGNPTGPICGCFLFHANRLGHGPRFIGPLTTPAFVRRWLGVSDSDLNALYRPSATIDDFERFYRARAGD